MIERGCFQIGESQNTGILSFDTACCPTDIPSMAVSLHAGKYARLGHEIVIANDFELSIDAPDIHRVEREEHILSDEHPADYQKGTVLQYTIGPVDTFCRLPKAILPESVRVYSPESGVVYTEGIDYFLDHFWGGMSRIASGSILPGQKVLIDYEVYLQRIDLIQISDDGKVFLKKGKSSVICPSVSSVDDGCIPIASIYIPYRTTEITQSNICPYPAQDISWRQFIKVSGSDCLRNTLTKLKNGRPVTVVCWGDSVTEGYSASSPDKNYVGLLVSYLKNTYPDTQINVINSGIGASSTESRREEFDNEVLSHNPDLITVEFINDIYMPTDQISSNWHEFISRARAHNPEIEFILLTPTFMMQEWMDRFDPAVAIMRNVAKDAGVALGDTTNIWAHLQGLGMPYETLLANNINHPDDLGHEFFAATLMELLGLK